MADTTIISLTETTSPTKDDVAVIVDNPSTSTPSNRKITLETLHSKLYSNSVQQSTDNEDVSFKQFDGVEVARIHDGSTLEVESTFTDATVDTNSSAGTGTTFGTNPKILTMANTALVKVGASISGTGIPSGSFVTSVANSTLFFISEDTTATGTNITATFSKGYWTLSGGTAKGGFGLRRPVYSLSGTGTGGDNQTVELTLQHSGAIIKVTGAAFDLNIKLPAIPVGCEGFHVDVAIITAFGGTESLEIGTNGDSGDAIYMYMNTAGTSGVDVDGGDVIAFTNAIPVGTICRLTCIEGGNAEKWIAEVLQPSGTAATTGTSMS